MSNSFWNFVSRLVAGTTARADDVNANFDGVAAGFTLVETSILSGITVSNETGVTDIAASAANRALKVISFDASGDVIASETVGAWTGDHPEASGTAFQARDICKDAAGSLGQDNIYICSTAHTSTSGGLTADTANWDLLIDVEQTAAYATAAQVSAVAAAASYDSFDDRYLGAKASAPTLDNDGDALITGALYFNSTVDKMYVRTSGAAWIFSGSIAADVDIVDAGGYITATEVEAALQEIAVDTRWISVTQAVDLDTMETNNTANTSKLAGIESGATADQSNAEIRTAVEAATDSNVFTDADHTKLNGIETAATADQSNAEIKTAYELNADTNEFSDAEQTKLAGIEAAADVTDTTNVTAAGALMDSEVDADIKTLSLPATTTITAFAATVLDDTTAAAARATLDVDQAGTGGMTNAEVKTAYEANANTNEFSDAEQTKLGTVESSADVTDTANVTSAGALMDSEVDADLKTLVLPALTTISVWGATLIDDAAAANGRSTLGLVIGTDVQAYSAVLQATTASFTTADNTKIDGIEAGADVTDVTNVTAAGALMDSEVDADIKTLSLPASTTISAFGKTLVDDAAASNARTTLGVVIGTNVQAYALVLQNTTASFLIADETKLDSVETGANVTDTANVTSAGALMDSEVDADLKTLVLPSNTTISTFGKSLIDDATAAAARTTLDVDQAGTPNYTHPNHSGQVTSTGDGATALAAAAISAQTDIGAGIIGTDEMLINDGPSLRRTDVSRIATYVSANLGVNSVDSDQYVDRSIDAVHIATGTITSNELGANSVDSSELVNGSVDVAHMAANSVDSAQYVDRSIDAVHIATGVITANELAANSVDSSELVNGSVDNSHMAANSVDSAQYVNGSIDGAHLANDAITGQTDIGAALADADVFMVSDNATALRKTVCSRIYTYIAAKMVAAAHTWAADQTFGGAIIGAAGNEVDSGLFAIKASDESVTSSTTLQDDDDLTVTLEANSTYAIEFHIIAYSASAGVNFQWKFEAPSGIFSGQSSEQTGNYYFDTYSPAISLTVALNSEDLNIFRITAATAGTGGAFKLTWAQNSSSTWAMIVKADSWVRAIKLA